MSNEGMGAPRNKYRDEAHILTKERDDLYAENQRLQAELDAMRVTLGCVAGSLEVLKRPCLGPDGQECAIEVVHLIAKDIRALAWRKENPDE